MTLFTSDVYTDDNGDDISLQLEALSSYSLSQSRPTL